MAWKMDREGACGRQLARCIRSSRVALVSAILFTGLAFATLLISWHLLPELGCLFRDRTGLPCPFCGMTRSIIATFELHVGRAFSYHLFGPLLVVLLLISSSAPFLPGLRERSARWMETHSRTCVWAANLGKILFLLYSFGRMLYTYMNFSGSVAS